MTTTTLPCSTQSSQLQEQLFGTAPTKRIWFLLEYTPPWGAKVLPESDLTPPVKAHLNAHMNALPDANTLFIKQSGRATGAIRFYVALAHETTPRLYAFDLARYEDLLDLDLTVIARRDPAFDMQRSDEALYLVCTNARRDACCARLGLPVYRELAQHAGAAVWQASHMGGHRFAPVLLCFPHGLCYGRIAPEQAHALVQLYREGGLMPEYLRGETYYDTPVQAASYYLRVQLGQTALGTVQLVDVNQVDERRWTVHFRVEGTIHQIDLEQVETGARAAASCNADKLSPLTEFRLIIS